MLKKLSVYFQYLIPQHLLSVCAGKIAKSQNRFIKNTAIRLFCKRYPVNLNEAILNNPYDYTCFNDFFTRQLSPNARPIISNPREIVSPVDGKISQVGHIAEQTLIQAKNHRYDLSALLARDQEMLTTFSNGMYMTLYLAPPDYHRVHMPLAGKLIKTVFVPGKLFSVNDLTASKVPNLYARNERFICLFDTEVGQVAIIFVGAMIVGSIKPAWMQQPVRSNKIEVTHYAKPLVLQKGDELGSFQLGSTVILLFEKQKIKWSSQLNNHSSVRYGESIAQVI